MSNPNSALYERLAVIGRTTPATVTAAATVSSDVIDMKNFRRVLFIINVGAFAAGTDGELAAAVYGDTASGGSFATVITGKAITTATFTGNANDDSVALIEVNSAEVQDQGLRYIRCKATPANQNLPISIIALGGDIRYGLANGHNLARVLEIIG